VRGKALPPWAAEFDCSSWSQFFLKYVVSHPAVTCAIPATSEPAHMLSNAMAGDGRLPDEPMRARMVRHFESL
jgi:diketogulonate reductase-like aldo/keto reductase